MAILITICKGPLGQVTASHFPKGRKGAGGHVAREDQRRGGGVALSRVGGVRQGPAPGAGPAPWAHLHDLQHLAAADVAVAVEVVHAEGPLELLLQLAPRGHAQRDDELPEVDGAVAVGVEGAEDVLGELGGVAVGEEVGVDLLELVHGQVAGGAVLEEALVPLLQLVVCELRVLPEVLQHFGPQLAVLFAHGGRQGHLQDRGPAGDGVAAGAGEGSPPSMATQRDGGLPLECRPPVAAEA